MITDDLAFGLVVNERAATEFHGDVGEDAACRGDVAFLDVGDGAAAFVDGGEEIEHVQTRGGRGVEFDFWFGHVFGKFLALENAVFVDGRAFVRNEIVFPGACFKRAFVAVKNEGPIVLRIGRSAPGAVLPIHREVVVVERGGLGVADVGLAGFVDEDSARGGDAIRPTELEHPARGVEHVHAHVADDAVAVFHEGAPPAGVRHAVERPQRGWASPHVVIEVIGDGGDRRVAVGAHVVVAADVDVGDFSEQAGFDDVFLGLDEVRRAFALSADLHDSVVLACRRDHGFAFHHIDADGFLTVNVCA